MTFADLTWEDMKEWAGSSVVTRAKSYRSAVEDLRLTDDGRLLSWVEGGDRYATVVAMTQSGKLSSECTCPYAVACKHAVATVLAYLDALQAGKSIPPAKKNDERLERLAESDEDENFDSEDWEDDGLADDDAPPAVVSKKRTGKRINNSNDTVGRYMEGLAHPALLEFVRELAKDFPEVRRRIADRAELGTGDVAKILASTRREIANASSERDWTRHWSDEGHIPDYSRVRDRLEILLASGHADEVLALGREILRRGIRQVEMSHDQGETGQEIADSMAIVFRALKASSLTVAKRVLWEMDARMQDDYSILDGIDGPFSGRGVGTREDWSIVADELARRLDAMPTAPAASDSDYRRQALMRWLLDALNRAGRAGEATDILTREAEITNCYTELVDHLLATKQRNSAAEWAHKGFAATIEKLPGIAWSLEERLRNIAECQRNLPMVAAFRAMEFFERPGADRYAQVRKAALPLGLWDTVRPMLLRWLETGARPDEAPAGEPVLRGKTKTARPRAVRRNPWPLPSTGLLFPARQGRHHSFPDRETLVAIAIQEKRNDDVLFWYKKAGSHSAFRGDYLGEQVATAVQETHPDEALAIWLRLAKAQIAITKPSAYETAAGSLKKMKAVYRRTERLAEWEHLLATLRAENSRKSRLIEVLNALEGRRSRILKR